MNDTKMMSPLVDLQGVSKAFGEHHVLKGIDLQVHAGQVLGLLGKNGVCQKAKGRVLVCICSRETISSLPL